MLARTLILKTSSLKPVERMVRTSRLFRPLVGRFIAGDDLAESLYACVPLLEKRIKVTLDYLGENTASEAEALAAKREYIRMLTRIAELPQVQQYGDTVDPDGRIARDPLNISIKLTQCGLDQGESFAETNYREVLAKAREHRNFVRVDMEASDYTERTLQMIERVWPEFKNTGTVLQSYLYRTDEDVERMIALGARVRIVKGAYLEPASVAYPEKAKVDEAYVRQAKRLLKDGYYPAIATQDDAIIRELKAYVESENIDKQSFEWQMLYGIRRDLQEGLVAEGFNVRVYVPFGDAWYPYFTRRLAERPANVAFIVRSFLRG
ncbi:MAG: proline dehydrogenase family protein [Fimbriimonadaceae bacterium]|nr:proline dehydrogenase family protein [Fimbriimonadaceae bacterium]